MRFLNRFSNIYRQISFIVLSFFLMFCFGGCVPGDNEWVLRLGSHKIFSGEYVCLLTTKLLEANAKISNNRSDSDIFNCNFDLNKMRVAYVSSKPAMQWAKDESLKMLKKWLLARSEFDKISARPDYSDESLKRNIASGDYDGNFADVNYRIGIANFGITKKTLQKATYDSCLFQEVISDNFGKGKPLHSKVDESAVNDFIKNNCIKVKMVKIPKNIEDPVYSQSNDKKTGSKLETVEGVKTTQELAEKYISEIKSGKTIDEISKRFSTLTEAKEEKELEPVVAFKFEHEKLPPEKIEPEIKKIICEIEPDTQPVLKENENFYFILQRLNLTDEDLTKQNRSASAIVFENAINEFFGELEKKNKIEFNNNMLKKYSPENMSKRISKYKPKVTEKPSFGGMPF